MRAIESPQRSKRRAARNNPAIGHLDGQPLKLRTNHHQPLIGERMEIVIAETTVEFVGEAFGDLGHLFEHAYRWIRCLIFCEIKHTGDFIASS